jgi:4-hydroxy-3-methylbut-2-en-1-yl diphosphate reductase
VSLTVVCALRIEAAALRGLDVRRTGMGRSRVLAAAARGRLKPTPGAAVVVAGFCAAVDPGLEPGDVVLASGLRSTEGELVCPESGRLEKPLRDRGLRVLQGTIHSAERLVGPDERRTLRDDAVAVDMESYWVAEATIGPASVVARVVVDTADRRLLDPRTLPAGISALRSLRRVGAALRALADSGRVEPLRY